MTKDEAARAARTDAAYGYFAGRKDADLDEAAIHARRGKRTLPRSVLFASPAFSADYQRGRKDEREQLAFWYSGLIAGLEGVLVKLQDNKNRSSVEEEIAFISRMLGMVLEGRHCETRSEP